MKKRTVLHDAIEMAAIGSHSFEHDHISKCFTPAKYKDLSSLSVTCLGIFCRYFILAPMRLIVLAIFFTTISVVFVFATHFNVLWLLNYSFLAYMKLFSFVLGIRAKHLGEKHRIKDPHIYVANHTSFIDYIILSSHKFHHAVISERHGGLFSIIFNFIISKNGSICFKRSDRKDRKTIKDRVLNHIKLGGSPMIIFPEGTCVNNKYCVLFQKSAFEMGTFVVPVSLKYKKSLGDPYWNRRKNNFLMHLIYIVTRWRIDVEVNWMAPEKLYQGENPIGFSHRIKKLISDKAQLINVPWNGYFKGQLQHADGDILKVAMSRTYLALIKDTFFESKNINARNRKEYLNVYLNYKVDSSKKRFFNSVSLKQFLMEFCIEFLRIKSLSETEKEMLILAQDLNMHTVSPKAKVIACNCPLHPYITKK